MAVYLRRASPTKINLCRIGVLNACKKSSISQSADGASKTFQEIPEPKGKWPFLGHLVRILRSSAKGQLHKDFTKINRTVGDVAKIVTVGVQQVILANPIHIEQVYRLETDYPVEHPFFVSWRDYRNQHGEEMGLLTSGEEHWKRMRGVIGKHMLPPKTTIPYFEPILNVTSDLLQRVDNLRDKNGFVSKLPNELYKWSMEAIGTVLFQRRLGTLKDPIDPKNQQFIDAVNDMFYTTLALHGSYHLQKKYKSKSFKRHTESWNYIFDFAGYYINEHLDKIEKGEITNLEGDLLANFVMDPNLSKREVVANVTELLAAAVDSTSNSVCFTLYLLSQNPDKQEKLIQEIDDVIGDGKPTYDSFRNMPYLRCVIKETFRILPVGSIQSKLTKQNMVIGGYSIPKGTMVFFNHYATSRDPRFFKDPETFLPERWEKGHSHGKGPLHPFATVPFSFGARSCVGRRFAELEMRLCLVKIFQKFRVEPDPTKAFKPILRTILTPGEELAVRFLER